MVTMHKRRRYRDKHEPGMQDLTLAFCAGWGTGAICVLLLCGFIWR